MKLGNLLPSSSRVGASKKPVVQKDKNDNIIDVFEGAREADRNTGANYKNISAVCRGERKTHKGYKWSFLKDEDATTIEKELNIELT